MPGTQHQPAYFLHCDHKRTEKENVKDIEKKINKLDTKDKLESQEASGEINYKSLFSKSGRDGRFDLRHLHGGGGNSPGQYAGGDAGSYSPKSRMPAADGAGYLKNVTGMSMVRKGGLGGDPVLRGCPASTCRWMAACWLAAAVVAWIHPLLTSSPTL